MLFAVRSEQYEQLCNKKMFCVSTPTYCAPTNLNSHDPYQIHVHLTNLFIQTYTGLVNKYYSEKSINIIHLYTSLPIHRYTFILAFKFLLWIFLPLTPLFHQGLHRERRLFKTLSARTKRHNIFQYMGNRVD